MFASVKALLSSIVDYAGLFPPAQLDLREAMANYAKYRISPNNWMLGRFVLPASRLEEFEALLPAFPLKQWSLSVIISGDLELEIERVQLLNNRNKIAITALEFPPIQPQEIKRLVSFLPAKIDSFFEIPLNADLEVYMSVLQHTAASAKIRTGGTTTAAFPSINQLSQCIFSFAKAQVSFKATAGLHHPLAANHRLTSDVDSPSTTMQGFLNVAVLAAFVYWQKVTPEDALELLKESSIDGFQFNADSISWSDSPKERLRDRHLNLTELKEARQRFFRSFGSCSFQEPIEDLKHLKLLS